MYIGKVEGRCWIGKMYVRPQLIWQVGAAVLIVDVAEEGGRYGPSSMLEHTTTRL